MSEVHIRFFATLRDRAGTTHLTTPLPDPATVDGLRIALAAQIPALAKALPTAIAAVNREYAEEDMPLSAGDEVAFFPPVSGGSFPEHFALSEEEVDLNALTQRIVIPQTGAIALFSGYVRGETDRNGSHHETIRLEYEAYEEMAVEKMQQVATEIRERCPLVQGIAIVQRVGTLQVGQPTILIACASGHRDQGCFEAARYGIDRLKEIVPIWKKEVGATGQEWVEGHYHPTVQDRRRA